MEYTFFLPGGGAGEAHRTDYGGKSSKACVAIYQQRDHAFNFSDLCLLAFILGILPSLSLKQLVSNPQNIGHIGGMSHPWLGHVRQRHLSC